MAADQDVVLIKARVLFRDPNGMQPNFECKSEDPKAEVICLRFPNSFTIDVRDVLIGVGLPRRMHAVLWVHTFPPDKVDLALIGKRKPSGELEVFRWVPFAYAACDEDKYFQELGIQDRIASLQREGRLSCAPD